MKKLLSVLMVALMLLTAFPLSVFAQENTLDYINSVYYISTVEDLKVFAKMVNEDGNCNMDVCLKNDITVNDGEFTVSETGEVFYNGMPVSEATDLTVLDSIGTSANPYKGKFSGEGYTVSGLYLNALFGEGSNASIHDVNIKNSYVTSNGILANILNDGYVLGCDVEGIVSSDSDNVGLLAGTLIGVNVNSNVVKGYVSGNMNVGGVAGYIQGDVLCSVMSDAVVKAKSTAGGFAGVMAESYPFCAQAYYCAAIGSVYAEDSVAGQFAAKAQLRYTINSTYNETVRICYAAVEGAPYFFHEATFYDTEYAKYDAVNQAYYMSDEQSEVQREKGFTAYSEEEMKSNGFVEELNKYSLKYETEFGFYGICFVRKDGEFPMPYSLHKLCVGDAGHTYDEAHNCVYYDCDTNELKPDSSITSVSYYKSDDTHNNFSVTAEGRAAMIQFIEPDGGTRTYDRKNKNVRIISCDANGNVVSELDRNIAYEIWYIDTNLSAGVEIRARAKYLSGGTYSWDVAKYRFMVELISPDAGVRSFTPAATSGKTGAIPTTVVTGPDAEAIRFKMPDGTTATYSADKATVLENGDLQFVGKAWANNIGENIINIEVKINGRWRIWEQFTYTAV